MKIETIVLIGLVLMISIIGVSFADQSGEFSADYYSSIGYNQTTYNTGMSFNYQNAIWFYDLADANSFDGMQVDCDYSTVNASGTFTMTGQSGITIYTGDFTFRNNQLSIVVKTHPAVSTVTGLMFYPSAGGGSIHSVICSGVPNPALAKGQAAFGAAVAGYAYVPKGNHVNTLHYNTAVGWSQTLIGNYLNFNCTRYGNIPSDIWVNFTPENGQEQTVGHDSSNAYQTIMACPLSNATLNIRLYNSTVIHVVSYDVTSNYTTTYDSNYEIPASFTPDYVNITVPTIVYVDSPSKLMPIPSVGDNIVSSASNAVNLMNITSPEKEWYCELDGNGNVLGEIREGDTDGFTWYAEYFKSSTPIILHTHKEPETGDDQHLSNQDYYGPYINGSYTHTGIFDNAALAYVEADRTGISAFTKGGLYEYRYNVTLPIP